MMTLAVVIALAVIGVGQEVCQRSMIRSTQSMTRMAINTSWYQRCHYRRIKIKTQHPSRRVLQLHEEQDMVKGFDKNQCRQTACSGLSHPNPLHSFAGFRPSVSVALSHMMISMEQ
eukprot:5390637-Amphidinium_carterae.1